jgi:uncharacterized protein YbjT (DUF2867 family)
MFLPAPHDIDETTTNDGIDTDDGGMSTTLSTSASGTTTASQTSPPSSPTTSQQLTLSPSIVHVMTIPVLVTGATGRQGRAVLNALIDSSFPFKILALTRNPSSQVAKRISSFPRVQLLKGDLNNPEAIWDRAGGPLTIWGVFSMQASTGTPGASPATEEAQGKALIDAALKNGVRHFVYSSIDRGADKSDSTPTQIPHFASKYSIEQHLKQQTEKSDCSPYGPMTWTILRPALFFNNLTPDFIGKTFATWWRSMGPRRNMQFISPRDVGIFATIAFEEPDLFKGKALSLAGDQLTFEEAQAVYREVIGGGIPTNFSLVGSILKLFTLPEMAKLFEWLQVEGQAADITETRDMYPELLDFRAWLQDYSLYQVKKRKR